MDKMKMHSPDLTQSNVAKIRALFPGCVTETHDDATGAARLAVDFDQLRQELGGQTAGGGGGSRNDISWIGQASERR